MDTKYLFKRHNTYWVKVAVPKDLRKELGFDLRSSLHTHDLIEAQKLRNSIVDEYKALIFSTKERLKKTNQKSSVKTFMPVTDTSNPQYYHKVVDCQYACPAHTPVPEYIRKISQHEYTEAYMINWESNVFPGILGRTCDRPCEPACRRTRTHEKPVAICRLKRVAADFKDDVSNLLPKALKKSNGKKIALIGGGPASLTVARDLLVMGYECTLFEKDPQAGGLMRTNIPSFRLPEKVLNEEVNQILDMGLITKFNSEIKSLKEFLTKDFDAVFIGTGAPKGKDLNIPGRKEAEKNIHIGIDFLTSIAFEHIDSIGKRVIVLGGGNTAMDCCRSSLRLGAEEVKVIVRSPFSQMKASEWEIEDAMEENIPILENHVPKKFIHNSGKLVGMEFEKVEAIFDEAGNRTLVPTDDDPIVVDCDDVLVAIGQDNSFEWIERDMGIEFGEWDMPVVNPVTFQSTHPKIFFGGDAAWGPENIIWAAAHGHQAAISIHKFCENEDLLDRPSPGVNLVSQKMGLHEWSYDNDISQAKRFKVPKANQDISLKSLKIEVEKGFDANLAMDEAQRCLNCDVQTVFSESLCIECDACVDICPTDCINFMFNGLEDDVRKNTRIPALNIEQDLLVSKILPTKRTMIKDEDVCLHCGLCAERCPTGAWDMQTFLYEEAKVYS
ncbi:pyridine nucleotide-disulfide oxidoreductase [SAR86 cluster bacterium SAR86E]|jgi:NADPH-dependent glutamate synthase beta subunit-like oxidoreductase|uniref:dihydrouracil dehydrogenase (NAD(+)) n=1 Tax=SAR86 cluster bacterium SAR86E TaxID=1208365 RepID=K6GIZ0_9GAMM|nr:pyridine nucleotide-disulfide oxidoreductase [SAR86 cluster bacterium SAR86E]